MYFKEMGLSRRIDGLIYCIAISVAFVCVVFGNIEAARVWLTKSAGEQE